MSQTRWHRLSAIHAGDILIELLAATSEDGIGVIARWRMRPDGTWQVAAMDTEGGRWEYIHEFREGEVIPARPPETPDPGDTARLDWMANHCHQLTWDDQRPGVIEAGFGGEYFGDNLRAAIDAAMTDEKSPSVGATDKDHE